jgi:capsular polysaccharide biosynthesis protein
VNDPFHSLAWPDGIGDGLSEGLWGYGDFTATDEYPAAEPTGGLVSLGFITAALKRKRRLWCVTAVLGLLIGCGLYLKYPPSYQASTAVFLTNNPNEDPAMAIATDQALAQSLTVAARVVQGLGLRQSVPSFVAATTVTSPTDQVLVIKVTAPTSADAILRTNALAAAFLQVRKEYLLTQEQQTAADLTQQINQAKQNLISANTKGQRDYWTLAVPTTEQYAISTLATTETNTNSMIKGSKVLDAAVLLRHSRYKSAVLYIVGGLVGGLAIGISIVVLGALVSDRLWRRDDVAEAVGAPVRLSVAAIGASRRALKLPWRAHKRDVDMRRVVAHLRRAVPGSSQGPAGLAVVAVNNAQVVAPAIVSLATSNANDGKQVVVADLSAGASAARLLGVKNPGVSTVSVNGANLLVVVPDRDDITPVGPLRSSASPPTGSGKASETLVAACASADLLLTFATLDPAIGADYLGTWTTDVVVMVTAGQSTATSIYAVGEMIRLAETRLVSVVLTGAEKGDESLGIPRMTDKSAQIQLG